MTPYARKLMPDGWTSEHAEGDPELVVITSAPPWCGRVTVDLKNRGYRAGLTIIGRFEKSGMTYTGRGWRDRLYADAIAWLAKAVTKPRS